MYKETMHKRIVLRETMEGNLGLLERKKERGKECV